MSGRRRIRRRPGLTRGRAPRRVPSGAWARGLVSSMGLTLGLAAGAGAQSDLGGQRVGTSAGTFLKIPIDARASALAGATSSYVSGPAALFGNPAGLGLERERGASFTAARLPADIPAGGVAVALPCAPLRSWLGLGLAAVGVTMDETDEHHPLGTGRSFSYTAMTLLLGGSRALTDKLSFGLSAKLFREELAPEVGGPQLTSWLMDAGAIYLVGYRDARIGLALSNFGPDLTPSGSFVSQRNGAHVRYDSFSPPTFFRFSLTIDPLHTEQWIGVTILEIGHPADNREVIRLAGELGYRRLLFLRSGYEFTADVLKLHAGLGARVRMGDRTLQADYAFAAGDYYGDIHRWSMGVVW